MIFLFSIAMDVIYLMCSEIWFGDSIDIHCAIFSLMIEQPSSIINMTIYLDMLVAYL